MVITFQSPYSLVFNSCKNVLKEQNIIIEYLNEKSGVIQATKSGSFLSWGEYIKIKITYLNNTSTKVEVNSSSMAQLIDWGTNSENEKRIIQGLSQILK